MGTKYYGASLTFYEKYSKKLTDVQLEKLELSSIAPDEADEEQDAYANVSVSFAPFFAPKKPAILG